MTWIREILRRLHFWIRGDRFDRDLADEMRLHLELRTSDRQSAGMSREDAEAAARRQFGNVTRMQEAGREAWGWTLLDGLRQDVRYGLRALVAKPAFTATAVLSLALGIGANTAIFSIINAVMLRWLPVEDPQALVQITLGSGGDDELNTPLWEQIRDRQQAFSGTLAYALDRFNLAESGEKRPAQGIWVSGDFFHVLGVPAMIGRTLTPADDRWGGGPDGAVAVISHDFWIGNFNSDPGVVGKIVRLNRQSFVVVGVTPPWFRGLDLDRGYDVAIPIGCQPILRAGATQADEVHHWWLRILARVAPGDNPKVAGERLAAAAPEILRASLPPGEGDGDQNDFLKSKFFLRPAGLGFSETRVHYRTALFALMAIVGLVLLIACANIANLLLARGAARRRELSVRMAIGASRARMVRQLMTESLLLAMLGAGGGFLLAIWGSTTLLRFLSTARHPMDLAVTPDFRLLGFTTLVAVVTALLFGLAPALRSTRIGLNNALKESDRGTLSGTVRLNFGKMLVGGQIALSMILLVGAGLFLGTLRNLLTVDPGFDRHNILLMSVDLRQNTTAQQRAQTYRDILNRLRTVPGVASAADSVLTPITPAGWAQFVYPEGYVPKAPRDTLVFLNRVSADYFRTMRTPVLMGREFSERDTFNAPRVILVNESTARSFFGNANPIGKTIGLDKAGKRGEQENYQVIGVVKDAKYNRIDEQLRRIAYLAGDQDPDPQPSRQFAIRSERDAAGLIPSIHTALLQVNRDLSLEFRSFDAQVKESLLQPRLVAMLSAIFGALALLLATVGLYGITTYSVARRKGEIGIRIALGAQRRAVIWLVMRDVSILLAAGMLVGWAASLAAGRLVASLLYGLRSNSPAPFAAGAVILAVATALAAYLPARRASRLDPMAALREE